MIDRRQFIHASSLGAIALTGCSTIRGPALPGPALPSPASSDLVHDVQERTFRYFWDTTDPITGLAPDRWPTQSFYSIAATGFALTAYPIGVVKGWITRDQARDRTLATLRFFANAPQGPEASGTTGHKGFFYHFLGRDGRRFGRTELSTIDTALLLGGVLFAQSWFDQADPAEREIRDLGDRLYAAIDWTWITPRAPFLSMGWHPETGFIPSDWNQYNESLLLYVLALASPTHPLPSATWDRWTATFDRSWTTEHGIPHTGFAPLFGHQYSQMWIDFRGIRDGYSRRRGLDYAENTARATHAQRRYAIANPGGFAGYDGDVWGLTACDGPGDFAADIGGQRRQFFSYSARGPGERDDGTIAPTAALGSIAFAPEIVLHAMHAMHARYGAAIYGFYGFLDSFNPTLTRADVPLQHGRVVPEAGWVDGDHLGIDQGPIVCGIENHRTGLVWRTMQKNPHIRRGLTRAGFAGGWLRT